MGMGVSVDLEREREGEEGEEGREEEWKAKFNKNSGNWELTISLLSNVSFVFQTFILLFCPSFFKDP